MSEKDWRHYLRIAEGYCALGLYDDAANELENTPIEFKVHRDVMAFRIHLYLQAERWEYARILAEGFAATDPQNASWWIALAFATRRTDSVDAALKIMRKAVGIHPKDFIINYNLACYAAQTGNLKEAKASLKQAIAINPEGRVMALDDPDLEPLWDTFAVDDSKKELAG